MAFNLTDGDVLDDEDPSLILPEGRSFTDIFVYDRPGDESFWATLEQVQAAILPDPPTGPVAGPVVTLNVSDTTIVAGSLLTLTATAMSASSTISLVEFYDNSQRVAQDPSQPYQQSYTPLGVGKHALIAKATDAAGNATSTAVQYVTVTAATGPGTPVVSLANIPGGTVGQQLNLLATAYETGGTIAKVEFFDGANLIGTAQSSPYATSYVPTTAGLHYFSAKATDLNNVSAVSATQAVTIAAAPGQTNQPPSVSLSLSSNSITLGQSVTLTSNASDTDGTVGSVTFKDGTQSLATVTQSPYTTTYTPTPTGGRTLSATAVDDDGATATATHTLAVNPGTVYNSSYATTNQDYLEKCGMDGPSNPITRTATSTDSQAAADLAAKNAAIAAIVCAVPNPSFSQTLSPGDNVDTLTWSAISGVQLRYNDPVQASATAPGAPMYVYLGTLNSSDQIAQLDFDPADAGHACAVRVNGADYFKNAQTGAYLTFTSGNVLIGN